ncbi:MAG: hypothetical protein HFJ80_07755 [Clostridiales bacterium]|nr:hypothetical protein [Clostridiales bacterium]
MNKRLGSLLFCAAEAVVGLLLLINPIGFTAGIIILLGVLLTILGLISVIGYFRTPPEEACLKSGLAKGLLLAGLGLFCIFQSGWFLSTFPLLTVFYGLLILIAGIGKLQWAIDMLRLGQKYWYVAMLSAAVSVAFSLLVLINPFATTAILWTCMAIVLLAAAAADLLALLLDRRK